MSRGRGRRACSRTHTLVCAHAVGQFSESWPKFKFFDFHNILKNLREGKRKVPGERNSDVWGGFTFRTDKQTERC
jgi:hypothetical protein